MIITYLVFGEKLQFYQEAIFSILSFLPKIEEQDKIVVLTDAPDKFKLISDRIEIITIGEQKLIDWKGKYHFFWRIKIKAIQFIADRYKNESILYLDSDTFLFGDLERIRMDFENGINSMHTNEGKLSEMAAKTTRIMWKQIKNRTYGGIKIDEGKCMWNAGVAGVSGQNTKLIGLALAICDEMCRDKVKPRLIEQFALSIALGSISELSAAETFIGHFWGNKDQWNEKINQLLIENLLKNQGVEKLTEEVRKMDFEEFPVRIKVRNTRLRLQKHILKIFPDRRKVFISNIKK